MPVIFLRNTFFRVVPLLVLMLIALAPGISHAFDNRGRDDQNRARDQRWNGRDNDGRRDNYDRRDWDSDRGNAPYNHGRFGRPVYFNNYRPPVVTRYVYQQPVIYYQRPPVMYYRDVVYYRNVPDYRIGQQLPEFYSVPQNILVQLDPPPQGYYYSMGPRNVYVVSHRNNAVAQIIDLLLQ